MGLLKRSVEPWGLLLACTAGTAAWAVGVPLGVDVLGAFAVLGVKVGAEVAQAKLYSRENALVIADVSPQGRLLARGRDSVEAFRQMAASAHSGAVAERCREIGAQANETVSSMTRIAEQSLAVASAIQRLDHMQLEAQARRLGSSLNEEEDPGVKSELQASLAAVRTQVDIQRRLVASEKKLLAKLQGGAIDLDGLVARLAEILALRENMGPGDLGQQKLDSLAGELDSLRRGLEETEKMGKEETLNLAALPLDQLTTKSANTERRTNG